MDDIIESDTEISTAPPGSLRKDRPRRKGSLRYSTSKPQLLKDVESGAPELSEEARRLAREVIASSNAPSRVQTPNRSRSSTLSRESPISSPPKTFTRESRVSSFEPHRLPPSPPQSRSNTPAIRLDNLPRSHTSSPTLVRNGSDSSRGDSPVMSSMFPQYDQGAPLAQQKYCPNFSRTLPRITSPPNPTVYSPSIYSMSGTSPGFPKDIARMTPASADNSPDSVPRPPEPKLSAPEELLDLWDIANGQGGEEAANAYTLKLVSDDLKTGQEIFSLHSSTAQALYFLEADGVNLTVFRSHPITPTPTVCISSHILSKPTTTEPLIANVFPKLAELMAIDQSSSVAVAHGFDRQQSGDLQAEALNRARRQEASSLFWDSDSQKYFLIHPTLSDGSPATFPIEIPLTSCTSAPSFIKLFSPTPAPNSNINTPASSLPLPSETPLLTLSLTTRTLTIHTPLFTALPSLYTLDTLLSALLTLLTHLHRTTTLISQSPTHFLSPYTPLFPPPPTLSSPSRFTLTRKFKFKSKFQLRKPKSPLRKQRTYPSPSPPHTSAAPSLRASPTLNGDDHTTSNFNPSTRSESAQKVGKGFQTLEMEDEIKLPAVTRGVLRALYWGFGVLVWVLGVGFRMCVKVVVGVGRCGGRV